MRARMPDKRKRSWARLSTGPITARTRACSQAAKLISSVISSTNGIPPSPKANQPSRASTVSAGRKTAARRAHADVCMAGAVPQETTASRSTLADTSAASMARFSRRSSWPRSSATASCRARTSSGPAGASNQAASASSPRRVRAMHKRSKSEPLPNRSRSSAQG